MKNISGAARAVSFNMNRRQAGKASKGGYNMGYLVPDTRKKMEQAVDIDLAGAFQSKELAEAMKDLIRAYSEMDSDSINGNKDQNFSTLFGALREFGLAGNNGVIEEEEWTDHFPEKQRTQENFKNIFHKLWKSISIAEEYKKNNAEEAEKNNPNPIKMRSVAEIYNNYAPVYDQILIEKDMLTALDTFGRFDKVNHNKYQHSLRNLNLMNSGRKADEPFNEKELKQIKEETDSLNAPFKYGKRGVAEGEGLFTGDNIKNSSDLQAYIDKYETMLRDRMTLGGKDYWLFAAEYKIDDSKGDTTMKLNAEDLQTVNRKINAKALGNDLEPLLKELDSLMDTKKAEKLFQENWDSLRDQTVGITQKLENDPDIKNAKAKYDKVYADVEAEKKAMEKEHNSHLRNGDEKRARLRENDEIKTLFKKFDEDLPKSDCNLYDQKFKDKTNKFREGRSNAANTLNSVGKDVYSSICDQASKEIPKYRNQISRKLEVLYDQRKELLDNPNQPDYMKKQQEFEQQIENLKNSLKDQITDYKSARGKQKEKLQAAFETYKTQMSKCYAEEKTHMLEGWAAANKNVKSRLGELKTNYQNSVYGKRMAKQELSSQLNEICAAMDSVKKSSFFQKTKGNSPQYTAMMDAIKGYAEGNVGADKAYQACEDYLKQSMDKQGRLTDMGSDAGKIRKQSCVRMMELLKDAPDFPKAAENLDVFGFDDQKMQENYLDEPENPKEKINYDALKASLAGKASGKVKNKKAKDAKAYSNLNEKLDEMKKAKAGKNTKKTENKKKSEKKPLEKKEPKKAMSSKKSNGFSM